MPRRPAQITQADVARIIRAAKQAGASEVVVKIGEQSVIVKLSLNEGHEPDGEIVLVMETMPPGRVCREVTTRQPCGMCGVPEANEAGIEVARQV
jgi:hypothetical protein